MDTAIDWYDPHAHKDMSIKGEKRAYAMGYSFCECEKRAICNARCDETEVIHRAPNLYLPFFGGSAALDFFVPRSFFARFFLSLRSLREVFVGAVSSPDRINRYLGSNFRWEASSS